MPAPSPHRAVLLGLLVNIALAAAKLLGGLVGHSYALVADAVESLADIFASLVIWSGIRIAARPADENHPYGHGKAEALAALFVSAMIFLAGIAILVKSADEIITPHHAPAPFTLVILLAVVIIKEVVFRVVARTAKLVQSGTVHVDAWHHRSDAITSLAAFIGIGIALLGGPGWEMADDIAAVAASFVILYNALRLGREPIRELMDEVPQGVVTEARAAASGVPGVRLIEKAWARKAGSGYFLDMHVQVDPQMNVREAHDIAHRVKDAIRARIRNVRDVLVHVEPFPHPNKEGPPEDSDGPAS